MSHSFGPSHSARRSSSTLVVFGVNGRANPSESLNRCITPASDASTRRLTCARKGNSRIEREPPTVSYSAENRSAYSARALRRVASAITAGGLLFVENRVRHRSPPHPAVSGGGEKG